MITKKVLLIPPTPPVAVWMCLQFSVSTWTPPEMIMNCTNYKMRIVTLIKTNNSWVKFDSSQFYDQRISEYDTLGEVMVPQILIKQDLKISSF